MQNLSTGGTGAGDLTPVPAGPITRMRGPYRVIAIITTVLMLAGGFALMPMGGTAQEATETRETTKVVHLRSAPALGTAVLETMPAGATVEVLAGPIDGFYHVAFGNLAGWAHENFLLGKPATADAATVDTAPAAAAETDAAQAAPAAPADVAVSGGGDIVQIIYSAAAMYGQSGDDLLRVAQCESTLNPNAYNASSGASGLFQFLPSTWATTPYAGQNIFDPAANAQAAAWMWSVGRRGEWVCQ